MQKLAKLYKKVDDAEDAYNIHYFDDEDVTTPSSAETPDTSRRQGTAGLSPMFQHSPQRKAERDNNVPHGNLIEQLSHCYSHLSLGLKKQFILYLLKKLYGEHYGVKSNFMPDDVIDLTGKAMATLQHASKDNPFYRLAAGLGKERPNGSGPRLPVTRMPFGLLHHNIMFFSVEDTMGLKNRKPLHRMANNYALSLWT